MFIGRVFGVYLSELLIDAVDELLISTHSDTNIKSLTPPTPAISLEYYRHLRTLEEADQQFFYHSDAHFSKMSMLESLGDGNLTAFVRGDAFCHTALLPSTARYRGLTNDSSIDALHHFGGYYTGYDLGVPMTDLTKSDPNKTGTDILLSYDPRERQEGVCPDGTIIDIDYKDWFTIERGGGWQSITLPNEAERNAHRKNKNVKREGMIILCTKVGGPIIFPDKNMIQKSIRAGKLDIRIDGELAVSARYVSENCFILAKRNGSVLWGPGVATNGTKGQYKIDFKLNSRFDRIYLSSIIII